MNLYEKYYLNENDILNILHDGIIVFDTSALLDIYYYSEESQKQIFDNALSGLEGRLWIPAQVYFEFLKNRDKVVRKPVKSYEALLDAANKDIGYVPRIVSATNEIVNDEIEEIKGLLNTLKETTLKTDKHPFLNQDVFEPLEQALEEAEEQIRFFSDKVNQFEKNITEEINHKVNEIANEPDSIQKFIEQHFQIGKELSFDEMLSISEEGRIRYLEKIPPGYEDGKNKSGMQKYGDLFAWKEILRKAKSAQKNVLLITNDVKVDWWDKEREAPCFELLKEFNSATEKNFWSCSMKDFLYMINKSNDQVNQISKTIIEEVDDVSEQIFVESLQLEIDNLYSDILKKWIETESEYILGKRIQINSEWRVFGKNYLFKSVNFHGAEGLIMMSLLDDAGYSHILHAFSNLLEIKKYFEKLGKEYTYRQVIVAKSYGCAKQIKEQMQLKTKLSRIFMSNEIENDLMYLNDGRLIYVASNHPMG